MAKKQLLTYKRQIPSGLNWYLPILSFLIGALYSTSIQCLPVSKNIQHTISAKILEQSAREHYWYAKTELESKKAEAIRSLQKIPLQKGKINETDADKILHGNAYLEGFVSTAIEHTTAKVIPRPDPNFKRQISAIRRNYAELTDRRIDRSLVDAYAQSTSNREHSRRLLNTILRQAGFVRRADNKLVTFKIIGYRNGHPVKDYTDYLDFRSELKTYAEQSFFCYNNIT